MTILYNCHSDGDEYRITKFIDGNPEASYLTSREACECPAGTRYTCRHRQMLPSFLNLNLVNTHWFLDWDAGGFPCDFQGTPKTQVEEMLAAEGPPAEVDGDGYEARDGLEKDEAEAEPAATPSTKPWRRL